MPERIIIPPNLTINNIIEGLKHYVSPTDIEVVKFAYETAERAHLGQTRKSGEPYIIHPLATAYILTLMRIDVSIVAAALLHDVPEDTAVTIEEIEKDFGPDIASMIRGITKLSKLKY
ncbi:MAG: HD domain-containing protein, partial [Patescibacteria group bacterium]